MESLLRFIEKLIPTKLYQKVQPAYHYWMPFLGAVMYRFPSRKLIVVTITGTKGKTTTTELVSAILEEAGHKTAVSNTVRFKIADKSERNLYKMSMPGRFFIQRFLRRAVNAGCEYAIIEVTSEAARFHRHKFIAFDALIFTNIAPEHIESHGSYENYVKAKLSIAESLARSKKARRPLVVNADDKEAEKFLKINVPEKHSYSLTHAEPYQLTQNDITFTLDGQTIHSHLSGTFNLYNILAAATYAKTHGIGIEIIKRAIEKFQGVPGRVEKIEVGGLKPDGSPKQNFTVVVDYAHTKDSLESLYRVFHGSKKICVLGNTGGGRDKWKRPEMAKIADKYCDEIILTNEDPYDENPRAIVEEMKSAIVDKPVEIIMDRREAIRHALSKARAGDAVLITGKGTDPYIMEANGKKTPWSDAVVAHEELSKLMSERL